MRLLVSVGRGEILGVHCGSTTIDARALDWAGQLAVYVTCSRGLEGGRRMALP